MDARGVMRLGTILQLPEGTQIRLIGDGFNERTVKVAWEGANYFVFLEDLAQHHPFKTRTAAGR